MEAQKRETWPDGYKEPEWLSRLSSSYDWPGSGKMLRHWIQQKARADAWVGVWDEQKIDALKSSVKWSCNWAENCRDDVESQRKKSFWWRIIHRLYQVPFRPKPFKSDSSFYEEALLSFIEERTEKEKNSWEKRRLIEAQSAASIVRMDEMEERLLGEIYPRSQRAIAVVERDAEKLKYDWSEDGYLLERVGMSGILKAVEAAMRSHENDRVEAWESTWRDHWSKALKLALTLSRRNHDLVAIYDAGRKMEMSYLDVCDSISPEDRAKWQAREDAHNQKVDETQRLLSEARAELRAML